MSNVTITFVPAVAPTVVTWPPAGAAAHVATYVAAVVTAKRANALVPSRAPSPPV